jgi:hypothetical protein
MRAEENVTTQSEEHVTQGHVTQGQDHLHETSFTFLENTTANCRQGILNKHNTM